MREGIRIAARLACLLPLVAAAHDASLRYEHLLAQARAIAAEQSAPRAPTPADPGWSNAALIGGFAAGVALYGSQKWWDQGLTSDFKTESEGWFGKDTAHGGADKLGHFYTTYAAARILAPVFEALGNEAGAARTLGAWTAWGVMAGVEVVDGYSKQYKFSREDFIANTLGAVFAYVMQTQSGLDAALDFRLAYRQSAYSGDWDPFGDYSGQRYLLVAKANAVPALRDNALTRYLEVSVGYGTRGYGEEAAATRSRDVYFGIGVNLSQLLADGFYGRAASTTRTQRIAERFLELVQLPVVAYKRKELGP